MDAGSNPASSTIRKNKGVSSVLGNLTNQPNKAFGLVLRYLRKERGLFQETLAREWVERAWVEYIQQPDDITTSRIKVQDLFAYPSESAGLSIE